MDHIVRDMNAISLTRNEAVELEPSEVFQQSDDLYGNFPVVFDIGKGPFVYEFTAGKHLNKKLLHLPEHQYFYKKNRLYKGKQSYRCREEKCLARVEILENGDCVATARSQPHNHAPTLTKEELDSLNKLKEEFLKPKSLCVKNKIVFDNHVAKYVLFIYFFYLFLIDFVEMYMRT